MSVSGVSGPGASQFPRGDKPVDLTPLLNALKALGSYAQRPTASTANALAEKLKALKAAADANPNSPIGKSYDNVMSTMEKLFPVDAQLIRRHIELSASASEAGAKIHEQLQRLTTADLSSKINEAINELRSDL